MAGMLADWQSYADPVNSINRPSQMGPLWYQARELSGMPFQDRLWLIDPPQSSYPACIAVKAAEMQSRDAAERYLRRLREAVMMEQQSIAKREVLLQLSDQTAEQWPQLFDAQQFAMDLNSREAEVAFREDLRHARYLGISRYPTLILRRPGSEQGLLLTGYRPYKSLLAAVQHVYPSLQPQTITGNPQRRAVYNDYWGTTLDRELQELNAKDDKDQKAAT